VWDEGEGFGNLGAFLGKPKARWSVVVVGEKATSVSGGGKKWYEGSGV